MKIVFACDTFYPCFDAGGVVHLFQVAKNLVKLGHEVRVICNRTSEYASDLYKLKDKEVVEGIEIYRTSTPYKLGATISSIPAMFQMKKILTNLIEHHEVDVCIPVQYRPILPFYLASRNKIPCLAIWYHTSLKGKFFGLEGWLEYPRGKIRGVIGWALEHMTIRIPHDGFITVSTSSKEEILRHTINKIFVASDGVDLDYIDSVRLSKIEGNYVVFISRLVEHKKVEDAIKAVKQARKEIPDLRLVIISPGVPQETLVRSYIENYEFIEYFKNIKDEEKFGILKKAKAVVHPSEKEGFGLVLIEALACKTPYISYDIPIMKEMKEKINGGLLVPYKDIMALSNAICLLASDTTFGEKLATEGRRRVEQKYTWDEAARKYENILEKLCHRTLP